MKPTVRKLIPVQAVAMAAAVMLALPAQAQFTNDPVGKIKPSGPSTVTIDTAGAAAPKIWFGLRVFTVPPGTMETITTPYTSNTEMSYTGGPTTPNGTLCVSDFQGRGSPGGGLAGPASVAAAPADRAIAMIGGFAGPGTGCSPSTLTIGMSVPGPITQAFYGAFYGTSPAPWRGPVGDVTGNPAWWNLWGNFTALGYSAG